MGGRKVQKSRSSRGGRKSKFNLIGLFRSIKWTKRTRLFVLIGIVAVLLLAFSFRGVGADVMTKSCVGVEGQCFEEDYPEPIGNTVKFDLKFIDTKTKQEIASPAVTAKVTSSNCYAAGAPNHPRGGCIIESKAENFTGTNFVSLYQIEKRTYVDGVFQKTTTTYFPGYKSKTLTNTVSSQWRNAVYTTKDSADKNLSITVKSPFTYTSDKSKAEAAISKLSGKTFSTTATITKTSSSNKKTTSNTSSNTSKKTTSNTSSNTATSKSQGATNVATSAADESGQPVNEQLLSCRKDVLAGLNSAINLNVDYVTGSAEYGRLLTYSPMLRSNRDVLFGLRGEVNSLDLPACQAVKKALPESEQIFRVAFRASKKKDFANDSKNMQSIINDLETATVATKFCVAALSWPVGGQILGSVQKVYQAAKVAKAANGVANTARVVNNTSKLANVGNAVKSAGAKIANATKGVLGKAAIKLAENAAKKAGIAAGKKAVATGAKNFSTTAPNSTIVKGFLQQSATKEAVAAATKSLGKAPSPAVINEIEKAVAKLIAGFK